MKNAILFACILVPGFFAKAQTVPSPVKNEAISFPYDKMPDVLPGTKPLAAENNVPEEMLKAAHAFIEEKIETSVSNRLKLWKRDLRSKEAYERSVEPNRRRFMKYIGVIDKAESLKSYNIGIPDRHPQVYLEKFSVNNEPELVAETQKYRIYQVRWPVFEKVYGEGLLLQPKSKPKANIIAIPDAGQDPEQIAGLASGVAVESQFARRLAENGFQVLVPVIISRDLLFPGMPQQQTYREWIYRQAFHMGGHIIGYEVQKVMSAIDWFKQSADKDLRIAVAGYFEGGLIAFYSAAVDKRIDAVLVSGYFNSRQQLWDEPIYRNVWKLLSEFGDAEIATLIAPRPIVIEQSRVPVIVEKRNGSSEKDLIVAGYKGKLQTPLLKDVQSEYDRIDELIRPGFQPHALIVGEKNNPVSFGSEKALEKLTSFLGCSSGSLPLALKPPEDGRKLFDSRERQIRQVKEMEEYVQSLLRDSDKERNNFFLYKIMPEFGERTWSTKPYHHYYSPERFTEKAKAYKKYFQEEIIGEFDDSLLAANPRTRKVYDKERWTGYEVMLDVYSNFFTEGILLLPKDIRPGERRPVVVCQHGRGDTPASLIEGDDPAYNNVAARLAEQGFIVYAPQNPYVGEDQYRWLCRKANTLGKTLFSFIVSQHDQSIRWLRSLPMVDGSRIAFYGLSYGGETAMRAPAVLEGYCLSICSGDFGNWTHKVIDTHYAGSFMNSVEWEMPYFNMGNTFSYAELAYLIFPRPFMVERGHDDLVQPDEWVSYEYGKVNYFFSQFNLADKTEIEFFNGGHSMRCDGTFKFLHRYLNWP